MYLIPRHVSVIRSELECTFVFVAGRPTKSIRLVSHDRELFNLIYEPLREGVSSDALNSLVAGRASTEQLGLTLARLVREGVVEQIDDSDEVVGSYSESPGFNDCVRRVGYVGARQAWKNLSNSIAHLCGHGQIYSMLADCLAGYPMSCVRHNRDEAWEGHGLPTASTFEPSKSTIVVSCSDELAPTFHMHAHNLAQRRGFAWLGVGGSAGDAWVGPAVVPRETACYVCAAARYRGNIADREAFDALNKAANENASWVVSPELASFVVGVAVRQVVALIGHSEPAELTNRVLTCTLDMPLAVTIHEVLRRPECEYCSPDS